jgi:hypothetical protein
VIRGTGGRAARYRVLYTQYGNAEEVPASSDRILASEEEAAAAADRACTAASAKAQQARERAAAKAAQTRPAGRSQRGGDALLAAGGGGATALVRTRSAEERQLRSAAEAEVAVENSRCRPSWTRITLDPC